MTISVQEKGRKVKEMRRKCPTGEVSQAYKDDKRSELSYNFSMTWSCDNLRNFQYVNCWQRLPPSQW